MLAFQTSAFQRKHHSLHTPRPLRQFDGRSATVSKRIASRPTPIRIPEEIVYHDQLPGKVPESMSCKCPRGTLQSADANGSSIATHFLFLRHFFCLPPVNRRLCSESRDIPAHKHRDQCDHSEPEQQPTSQCQESCKM